MADVDPHAGHNHGSKEEDEGLSVDSFKIIMNFMMILCVGLGIIPKIWPACQKSENALSFLNCFSAGIFLGMSLVHMMPEATEIYAIWAKKEGIEKPFPLPYVGFFMGYMLILGVDRVAAKACGVGHSHGAPVSPSNEAIEMTDRDESPSKNKQAHGDQQKQAGETVSKAAAIILVLALGAHAFFEGIAFGLQTTIESAGQLAAGILIHKSAAAISLGGAFARTGYTTKQIIMFLALFSIIAPLGIIIGM